MRISRRAITIILMLLALPVVIGGYWLLAPLFITERVDEEFPLASNAVVPADMTMEEAEAIMVEAMSQREPYDERAPDGMAMLDDSMKVDASVEQVKTGLFRDADSFHRGMGAATIYRAPSGESVLRLEEFRVTNGPELHVLLVPHADPQSRDDVSGYYDLGELKGNEGNQNYPLPPEVDAAEYNSVVIYCLPFRVIFSVAPLN